MCQLRLVKILMEDHTIPTLCQIHCLQAIAEPIGILESIKNAYMRIKRIIKRRVMFFHNLVNSSVTGAVPVAHTMHEEHRDGLHAGDRIRIKPTMEIGALLDNWNQYKNCAFMEEMWQYCGTEQVVLKSVERFLDERDYRVKRVKGIVILSGVTCQGTVDFGPCDRSCYFFWREEWLDKLA